MVKGYCRSLRHTTKQMTVILRHHSDTTPSLCISVTDTAFVKDADADEIIFLGQGGRATVVGDFMYNDF